MTRIVQVALRDFLAVVTTRGFVFGLVATPAIGGILVLVAPSLFDDSDYRIAGEYAIVDPTGAVAPRMRAAIEPDAVAGRRLAALRRGMDRVPEAVRSVAEDAVQPSLAAELGPPPDIRLTVLPADAGLEAARAWLAEAPAAQGDQRRAALIVIHDDAVTGEDPAAALGTYDLYVPAGLDDRDLDFCHEAIQEAIAEARAAAHGLDRAAVERLLEVDADLKNVQLLRRASGFFGIGRPSSDFAY